MSSTRTSSYKASQRRRTRMIRWVGGLIAGVMVLAVLTPAMFSVGG